MRFAQTNVELYEQLQAHGYSIGAMTRVRSAYELASRLNAGRLQSSGRPFTSHLVGTSSILVHLSCDPALVVAGLLHSAYRKTGSEAQRRRLREAVGDEVERLVFDFSKTRRAYPEIRARLGGLGRAERDGVTLLLADELEKLASRNVLYSSRLDDRLARYRRKGDDMIALAGELGPAWLAHELERGVKEVLTANVPSELRSA